MQIIDAINNGSGWLTLKPMVIRLIALAACLAVVRTLSRILIFTPGRYVEYDFHENTFIRIC